MNIPALKQSFSALMISALLLPAVQAGKGGNKGGGNNDGSVGGDTSGAIFCQLELDDGIGNYLESDGLGAYIEGVDMANIAVGRNRSMQFDFNTHKKKAAIRRLNLWGDLPAVVDANGFVYDAASLVGSGLPCEPQLNLFEPLEAATLDPDLAAGQWNLLVDAAMGVGGEDHDNAEVGCIRHVNTLLTFTDNSGENWYLYFGGRTHGSGSIVAPCSSCLLVTRLSNVDDDGDPATPGLAQWHLATEGPHLAYLYHDNRPPHHPTAFHSIVQVPFSATVTSLSQEEEPDPNDPDTHCLDSDDCPNPAPITPAS